MPNASNMRARVVLVQDDCVALIERVRSDKTYYLFPGGGLEDNETTQQAAMREANEELGLNVEIGELLAVVAFDGDDHYFYHATATGAGEWGTGDGPEYAEPIDSDQGTYHPVWIPIAELAAHDVRPVLIAQALVSGEIETWRQRRFSNDDGSSKRLSSPGFPFRRMPGKMRREHPASMREERL